MLPLHGRSRRECKGQSSRPPVTPVQIEQTGQRAAGQEINLDLARRGDRIIEAVDGRIQP
jgi:hypothetical protein